VRWEPGGITAGAAIIGAVVFWLAFEAAGHAATIVGSSAIDDLGASASSVAGLAVGGAVGYVAETTYRLARVVARRRHHPVDDQSPGRSSVEAGGTAPSADARLRRRYRRDK
jgi:hypothetical protein